MLNFSLNISTPSLLMSLLYFVYTFLSNLLQTITNSSLFTRRTLTPWDEKIISQNSDFSILVNEDCLFEVLKYLSIQERVRLERVARLWRLVLVKVWLVQKVLVVGDEFWLKTLTPCREKRHHFVSSDVHITKCNYASIYSNESDAREGRAIHSIVLKCRNLRALYCLSDNVGQNFGHKLMVRCPNLEHLYAKEITRELYCSLLSYPLVNSPSRLQCVLMDGCIRIKDFEKGTGRHLDFLNRCPNLKTFIAENRLVTPQFLNNITCSMEGFRVFDLNADNPIEKLSPRLCANLLEINIEVTVSQEVVSMITRLMPNLRRLDLSSNPSHILYLSSLKNLEDVKWGSWHEFYDPKAFQIFVENCRTLKSLSLNACDLPDSSFSRMSTNCPDLEEFEYQACVFFAVNNLSDATVVSLSKLQRLKKLSLQRTRISRVGLQMIRSSFRRLNQVVLTVDQFLFPSQLALDCIAFAKENIRFNLKLMHSNKSFVSKESFPSNIEFEHFYVNDF